MLKNNAQALADVRKLVDRDLLMEENAEIQRSELECLEVRDWVALQGERGSRNRRFRHERALSVGVPSNPCGLTIGTSTYLTARNHDNGTTFCAWDPDSG
jgi:hypothetical protein